MDGGTVYNVDPISAVDQCLEIVDSEEDIIMDILFCRDYELEKDEALGKNSIWEFFRGRQIHSFTTDPDSIADVQRAYPNIDYRHLFLEMNDIIVALDFRNQTTWPYQM